MSTRVLIILTIVIFLAVGVATFMLDANSLSALGSIIAAGGSLAAVLWFSASLRHQATQLDAQMKQLEDQRVQFRAQYEHLQESSRRDALLIARDILDKAEAEALKAGSWASLGELTNAYMHFGELGPLTTSKDPDTVLKAFETWSVKENAAVSFLNGVKSAAEIYLRGTATPNIDFSKDPEEFCMVYGPWFQKQPFFSRISGHTDMLAELLVRLKPGRAAAQIAFFVASDKTLPKGIIRAERIREDIEKQRSADHLIPAIAEGYSQ
ncbi:MAG: hypothetical protein C0521_09270 [Xanthomonas sp.]|nr:hypothetical protein [Xanthomonas sp.]